MKDIWFADNRDLVKWSVLFHLAERYRIDSILQIAYYTPSIFSKISIDSEEINLPPAIINHFRNIRTVEKIDCKFKITVFDRTFDDRKTYLDAASKFIRGQTGIPKIVFLDPDTGLAPKKPLLTHVLDTEANTFWNLLELSDLFVFYQHQTNRNGQPWIKQKRKQLAVALGISDEKIKVAQGKKIARDVVFYYALKI